MSFFLICGNEDGMLAIEYKTESALKQGIEDHGLSVFRDGLRGAPDTNYWRDNEALIIKGDVIVPKPKEVVKDWEF